MSTKIGHFEIQSELAKSPTGAVFKATDSESGQTVALKAIQLSAFGESADALREALVREVESVKSLNNPNATTVISGSEIDGQFCASMEYVQGNSIATMLARGEGFSIWDLLDIGRQLCSGFDYASSHGVIHRSLEPSKIMCGWDGTVKILSYGVSSVGDFVQHAAGEPSSMLHYMSPEQVRGEAVDGRSNLFSLGAMFYEMVTERRAFGGSDVDSLRRSILESTPAAPVQLNAKVHPLLSDLIMKTLSKDPAKRYQTGRALLDDLENCKESRPATKKAEAPKGTLAPPQVRAAAQAKLMTPGGTAAPKPPAAAAAAPRPAQPAQAGASAQAAQAPKIPAAPVAKKPQAPVAPKPLIPNISLKPTSSKLAMPKASAAAAGIGTPSISIPATQSAAEIEESVLEIPEQESAYMSSAVADEPQVETFEPTGGSGPKIAVDPMMAEGAAAGPAGTSFSEISELPPLKEVYVAPQPAPAVEAPMAQPAAPSVYRAARKPEKPKVQPREVADKAIKEIKTVPPKLFAYALGGALGLILIIGIGVTIYIHSQNDDDSGSVRKAAPVVQTHEAPPAQTVPPEETAPAPVAAQPAETQPAETAETAPAETTPEPTRRGGRRKAAPAVTTGDLSVDSTPQGAQVAVDGQTDPSWLTPFAMTSLQPGQHTVGVSKSGYAAESRSVNVASGGKASSIFHLAQQMATLIVKSNPAGANIYVDGRDVGARTPAQVSVNKGQHVVLVRLSGYLDETMNAQFALGQTSNFSPALRPMGNVDSIKTVGKMGKLFGHGAKEQAVISIHTQPKGAQIAINQHMLDKNSPVDVMIDPGNYEIDITLSGYAPIHRVINADRGNKTVVDEVLTPQ